MKFYAAIDTNVVISALLKPISVPGEIIKHISHGKIIPLLHEKFLSEYTEVINRPKFKIPQERIKNVLNGMTKRGIFIDAKDFEDELPDPKDVIFYHVVLTAREEVDAYLVTGNLKHFPIKTFVVTPREMLDIIERDTDEFFIREMNPNEYCELENFLYEAIYVPDGEPQPPREILSRPELQVYVKNFGTQPADVCFVAETDEKIVGACWARIMNDYGHFDDETPSLAMSVLKNFRRKGIAIALLKNILARLAEKNFKQVSLSVQQKNSAAIALYRKFNFEVVDERGEEFLMCLTLEAENFA